MTNGQGYDGTGYGADGIVFIVNGITNIVGSNGGGMGYMGLGKSVGIELDTWYNPEFGDQNGNHIGIDINGAINSVQQVAYPTLLNDGNTRYCWVDFNGVNKTLEVRVADSTTRPATAQMTRIIDLAAVLGTQDVFVGFSAATGGSMQNHIITSWEFTNIFAPIVTPPTSVCGNNVIENGEQCDGGACCSTTCTFKASSATCRASNGPCDVAETCTGSSASCPADSFASSAVTCRAASSVCDVAETCTGAAASCPSDSFASSTVVCRASVGHCDPSETCTGSSAVCPADVSGHFESACSGLALNFGDAGIFSIVDYDVISFDSIVGPNGAIDGRAAAKGNVALGTSFSGGYSVGYQVHSSGSDNTLPYSLVAGGDLIFQGGAVYPDGLHNGPQENIFVGSGSFVGQADLGARVNGTCNGNTGCFNAAFSAAQTCYGGYQAAWAAVPTNVQKTIEWSGLYLDCQDPSSSVKTYFLDLSPAEMSQYTWISMSNCNANARWIINIVGTSDVTFTAGTFPAAANAVVYNVIGSGRTVNVQNIYLQGHLVAPFNTLNQPNGNIVGKSSPPTSQRL